MIGAVQTELKIKSYPEEVKDQPSLQEQHHRNEVEEMIESCNTYKTPIKKKKNEHFA